MPRDYYETLGISRDASPEEVQRAFRTQARRFHPDVNRSPDAEERFKQINEAYQVLSDPESRERYDRFGPDFRRAPQDGSSRGGARGAGTRGTPFTDADLDLDELFGGLFGFGGRGPMAGADQEAELELSVAEAFRGGRRRITLDGRGYDVNIPPGVTDGQRIRLAGQGGRSRGGAAAGDLYLVVRIAPDPRYRVEGRDLHTRLPVAPWEAVLGARVPVRTPGGEARVSVPAGSTTGRRLRLRGQGMPNPRGPAGDLYAELEVQVPTRVTGRERDLYEELGKVSTFDPRESR